MMKNNFTITYHLERNRERSGKFVWPMDFIFEHFINAYLRNADQIEDVVLVPVTINYDKIIEGYQFPYELLGEAKPKYHLFKVLKQIYWVRQK